MSTSEERVKLLFEAVVAAEPAHRQTLLDGLDSKLRDQVESLVAASDDDSFPDRQPPVADVVSDGTTFDKATAIRPPTDVGNPERIGPYRVIRQIGEGGMGAVFEAEQEKPVRRKVATSSANIRRFGNTAWPVSDSIISAKAAA